MSQLKLIKKYRELILVSFAMAFLFVTIITVLSIVSVDMPQSELIYGILGPLLFPGFILGVPFALFAVFLLDVSGVYMSKEHFFWPAIVFFFMANVIVYGIFFASLYIVFKKRNKSIQKVKS